jgi:hypothetical protein
MRRRLACVLAPLAVVGLTVGLISGCKQKAGERCQVNDDCDTDLVCNQGTGVCQPKSAVSADSNLSPDSQVDAGPIDSAPIDGAPIDGTPVDGAVDAMPVDAT